jgi:hypothetical protein
LSVRPAEQRGDRMGLAQRLLVGSHEGIPLYGRMTEVDLWLPPDEFRLRVLTRAGYLAAGNAFRTAELATQTIRVPAGRPLEVALQIQSPPPTEDLGKE